MVYLNCHTWHSLRYGTFSEKDLCRLAKKKGIDTLGVTDINSSTACLCFSKIASGQGIKPLFGIDFRNGSIPRYTGLAQSKVGFRKLNDFLSRHLHRKEKFPSEAPTLQDCYVIYPFEQVTRQQKTRFESHEFIGVSLKDLPHLKFSPYKNYRDKLVFQQTVTVRNKRDHNAHRLLRAIDLNALLSKLPKAEQAAPTDKMYGCETVRTAFTDYEFILDNTEELAKSCRVDFEIKPGLNKNLSVYTRSKKEDAQRLRQLCKNRLKQRYPHPDYKTLRRVIKELQAIIGLGFVSYFLINLDIIEYARSQNFPFIGRGSGANSVIAYILGITNVDPIELNLYFERFINPNRSSPPDFDLDFSWRDREAVTQYIFDRYAHTALMGTYVRFKRRAVARELGKVLGLPKANIDKLSKGDFQVNQLDEIEKLVIKYSRYIEGFPNYRSVHSGGIMILDEPVHNFAATFLPPKGFATIQIDMNIAEEAGIHKFDILAQRGLPKITDAVELIKKNQPEAELLDLEKDINRFKTDPEINSLLKTGDCMGVFYVESPAMRGLLTQLKTDTYYNLVAASSIIRPGVSGGGMKEEYIKRHRHPEKRKEAHPVLYEIMPETYGVMVYQEDVMKVVHYFAGLGLDDADVLRRGMSGKKTGKGQMERIKTKFRKNCRGRGYASQLIDEVWQQIASFAGYAFPKGHSASYAVESYQSLYLKCYFPLEFMTAVLNNGGGFYSTETYLQEIRNCGGVVHGPQLNKSEHETSIVGKDVYLGFGYIKELEWETSRRIIENRNFYGTFTSLENFLNRVQISLEQIRILIRINAFRFVDQDKYRLLWRALFMLNKAAQIERQKKLFESPSRKFKWPTFEHSLIADSYDQLELLGFSLQHPFRLLKQKPTSRLLAEDLKQYCGNTVTIYGYLITVKRTRTKYGRWMYFGTFFDYKFGIFNTVHFPNTGKRCPFQGKGIYKCTGRVNLAFDYVSLSITHLYKTPIKGDPRFVRN